MTQGLTITQLNRTAIEWIEQESQRTGKTVEDIARQLIYRALDVERRKKRIQRYQDLDSLAGTWSPEEAAEFHQATADMNRIDESLWS